MDLLQGMVGAIGAGLGAGALTLVIFIAAIINPPTQQALTQVPGPDTFNCQGIAPCLNPTANGVVQAALSMVPHLHQCRNADDPPGYTWDKCYDSGMPLSALHYWASVCSQGTQCYPYWQSGDLQCVEFVTAAYAMAGDPLPKASNAIDFWNLYNGLPGWTELAVAGGWNYENNPPSLPQPGDLVVWYNTNEPTLGHIAIVVDVHPPANGGGGYFDYAEANGPAPVMAEQINPNLSVSDMTNFFTVGYIRHVGSGSRPRVSGEQAFVCALLPFARTAQANMLTGAHPVAHPWAVSLILAQWGVEQGWITPTYTGYNFGNVSAYPGFPSVGGTGAPGSPGAFSYGQTAEQGVDEYVTFAQMNYYAGVAAAYAGGPDAQATAMGQSPWDAAHYDSGGGPGSKLMSVLHTFNLAQYDNPSATC